MPDHASEEGAYGLLQSSAHMMSMLLKSFRYLLPRATCNMLCSGHVLALTLQAPRY